MRIILLAIVFVGIISVVPVFADEINLDKTAYEYGNTIKISGSVSLYGEQFVGLQILSPSKADIVTIDQFLPNKDGKFSKSYKAQGPKWQKDGIYIVKIVYGENSFEKTFSFKKDFGEAPEKPSNSQNQQIQPSLSTQDKLPIKKVDPKTLIKGFPDPYNSPQYYLDRYSNELEFKKWFDDAFEGFSIQQVVGYTPTYIPGFPDNENSPWYYVQRYNNEEVYQDWFDSQFPDVSIYEILGFPESSFQKVPNWVKHNAKWWSTGLISDADFLFGIEYLISENIIVINENNQSSNTINETIPGWIKNTAGWWADDLISENDFVKGIQFLIENGIINV